MAEGFDLYEIADELEPEIRRIFLEAIEKARRSLPTRTVEEAFRLGDRGRIMSILSDSLPSNLRRALKPIRDVLDEIMGRTAFKLASFLNFRFDTFNPLVLEAIEQRTINLVESVSADAVEGVRRVVSSGWLDGITVARQAQMIRPLIGLTPGHAVAVARFFDRAKESLPHDEAVYNATLYANRLLNYRARVIARTENINAASSGQYLLWQQMERDGILQPHRTWVEWIVTDDDRLCPFCAPMEGQRVRLNQRFVSRYVGFPDGEPRQAPVKQLKPDPLSRKRDLLGRFTKADLKLRTSPISTFHPPLHPQCRCDLVLAFD